jgi:hypothetical protein
METFLLKPLMNDATTRTDHLGVVVDLERAGLVLITGNGEGALVHGLDFAVDAIDLLLGIVGSQCEGQAGPDQVGGRLPCHLVTSSSCWLLDGIVAIHLGALFLEHGLGKAIGSDAGAEAKIAGGDAANIDAIDRIGPRG